MSYYLGLHCKFIFKFFYFILLIFYKKFYTT